MIRTYLKIIRVCDGGHFRTCREARSDIGSLPMSDKRQRQVRKWPRPKGLCPKSAACALLGLARSTPCLRLAPSIHAFWVCNARMFDFEIGSSMSLVYDLA
jgi:hypothetical protein